jgi:hypothetical protein
MRIDVWFIVAIALLLPASAYFGNFPNVKVDVAPGTTVEYLQYRAEATCFVRVGKNVIDASPCPDINKDAFKLEREEKTELWIHVTVDSGGRLMVDKTTIKTAAQ